VASEDFLQTTIVVPSPPFPPLDKAALRQAMREARRSFVAHTPAAQRSALEQKLAARLEPLLAKSGIVGGYCPVGSEISPLAALERAAADGATIAYPAFADRSTPLTFRAGKPGASGPWKIPQPPLDEAVVLPDVVLVPLLAIDARGTRIGQGQGHYDRVLGSLRDRGSRLIGIGWVFQRLEIVIPADEWDVPLHGFASPEGYEVFPQ
jgi:5-formyltetrahydrofolate cyclo-ligase